MFSVLQCVAVTRDLSKPCHDSTHTKSLMVCRDVLCTDVQCCCVQCCTCVMFFVCHVVVCYLVWCVDLLDVPLHRCVMLFCAMLQICNVADVCSYGVYSCYTYRCIDV